MKKTKFHLLMMQYVTQKTSALETIKIEVMLSCIRGRSITFISEETEEMLCQKIKDERIPPEEITRLISNLSKLRVPGLKWVGINPFEVYFSIEAIE